MSVTILYDQRATDVRSARADGDHLWLDPADLATATGWKLETEGLCRDDACVRVQPEWRDAGGRVDLGAFARYMAQPVIQDDASGAWAFGESVNARRDRIDSLEAPDFRLPDLDGRMHALSDYRGKKVFLYSWGSY